MKTARVLPFWKQFCLIPLILAGLSLPIKAQTKSDQNRLDELITQVPVLMRTDEAKARLMIDELAQKSEQEQNRHGIIQSTFFKAWLSYRHEPADVAINKLDSALKNIEGIQADTALIKFFILKGQCFVRKTQFNKALENFKLALQVAEKRNDQASKISTLISIGWAYMEDNKPKEAIRFFNEVLEAQPSPQFDNRALLLCNIASCYNALGDYKLAESFALKGIEAARMNNNHSHHANGLNILARSYYQVGKKEQAITILKEAATIREKVADPSMLISDYLELADLYMKIGQPLAAVKWGKKAEVLSVKYQNRLKLSNVFQSLSQSYEAVGDHKNASQYYKKLLQNKDSLANSQYNEAFAQMQVQYETQKKTTENLQLKKENLETKLRNSNQQRWLLLLGGGLLFLIGSGIYISKLMKSRYKTRLALEQLNEQKKRAIAVMEAEEKERRRIAADLHDGVGQTLAAASMQLNKAIKSQQSLDKVDELILQAGTEVRNLSHKVTPELLLHYGLEKALQQAVVKLNEANDTTTFTLFTHLDRELDDEIISLTLYRCFQELSTNILKHARASEVAIQLNVDEEEIELMVEDNGVGFQQNSSKFGLGLRNMESRIAPFDGKLVIDSTPGKGTTSIIRIHKAALIKDPISLA